MLDLDQTALLLDGLKPPPGMDIDAAIGTTFTLDLSAMLSIPVAAPAAQATHDDSASVLETIRRYADRTIVFCQAGAISVPPRYREGLALIEHSVVEVRKPDEESSIPKCGWSGSATGHVCNTAFSC